MKIKPWHQYEINDYWTILAPGNRYLYTKHLSTWRTDAITDFLAKSYPGKTWKQAYRKGYRAVKVTIVERKI